MRPSVPVQDGLPVDTSLVPVQSNPLLLLKSPSSWRKSLVMTKANPSPPSQILSSPPHWLGSVTWNLKFVSKPSQMCTLRCHHTAPLRWASGYDGPPAVRHDVYLPLVRFIVSVRRTTHRGFSPSLSTTSASRTNRRLFWMHLFLWDAERKPSTSVAVSPESWHSKSGKLNSR